MDRATILVTGGAGFIGSHVVDCLVKDGHRVIVVDNLSTGSKANLNPGATFYELDICSQAIEEVFKKEKPQFVNHHAAQTVVARSESAPAFDAEQNILGSINVIQNCLKSGVKKVIYASSAAVYGNPEYRPVDENHPVNPISSYGISKHTVEHYLHLYSLQYGLNYAALRYSNVYGSRQNPESEAGVVAIFTTQMLSGKRPVIYGTGDKTRDYVHVSDVAAANLKVMELDRNFICNVSTGIETSDQSIFDMLASLVGYTGTPGYVPVRKGEIYRISLACGKAKDIWGWQPNISVKEGLAQAVNYYK